MPTSASAPPPRPAGGGPRAVDRALWSGALFTVGEFRARPADADFRRAGQISHLPTVVFPRTAVAIQHDGRRPFVADPCTTVLYNQRQPFRRFAVSDDGDRGDWYRVAPTLLAELLGDLDPGVEERADRPFRLPYVPTDPRAYLLQRAVVHHLRVGPVDDLLVEETLVEVLRRALVPYGRRIGGGRRRGAGGGAAAAAVAELRALLDRRLADRLSLAELARAVGYSAFHLCRVFRRETGRPIHRYRTQLRLSRSLELLAAGDGDVTGVALDLGFSSHSHFTATFRQTFAVTPSAFRRRATAARIRELRALL